VLDQNARARLANILVANPERARQLENMIVQMARYGQIRGKLDEDTLKSLLAQV
jgi:programmed cell death protein 5